MTTEIRETPSPSLIAKLISSQRSPWITLGVGLALILAPIGVAYIDAVLRDFLSQGYWGLALLPPAVIIYILFVSAIPERGQARVIEAFRPLVQTVTAENVENYNHWLRGMSFRRNTWLGWTPRHCTTDCFSQAGLEGRRIAEGLAMRQHRLRFFPSPYMLPAPPTCIGGPSQLRDNHSRRVFLG